MLLAGLSSTTRRRTSKWYEFTPMYLYYLGNQYHNSFSIFVIKINLNFPSACNSKRVGSVCMTICSRLELNSAPWIWNGKLQRIDPVK